MANNKIAQITFDSRRVRGFLTKLEREQYPFASSLALNWTAQEAVEDIKKDLRKTFTLRNTWTEKGIRFFPSSKRKLQATVYSKDWYMDWQEEGGTFRGTYRTSKRFARPLSPGARLNKSMNVSSRRWPSKLDKSNHFVKRSRFGDVLFRRGKNNKLTALFALVPQKRIKTRHFFERNTNQVMDKRFAINFERAMKQAVETAKRGV